MRFAVACLALCFAQDGNAGAGIFLHQSSTVFSEPVPVALYEDDLKGEPFPDAGTLAVTFNSLEVGFDWRNFELAYVVREDYIFEFSEDTFDLIYRDKNRLPIDESKTYDVFLKAQHIQAEGWRVGYVFEPEPWAKLRFSAHYWQADELLYGTISGRVTVDDGDINGGNLAVFYHYHEDYILKRKLRETATGYGHSFSLGGEFALRPGLDLELQFYDLLGEIRWRNAPYSDLRIASTQTYYDAAGYAHRDPMLEGRESNRDFTQPLPLHYEVRLTQALPYRLSLTVGREQYEKAIFNRLFVGYELFDRVHLSAGYDFTAAATWLGLDAPGLTVHLGSDTYDLDDAHSLVLRVGAHLRF